MKDKKIENNDIILDRILNKLEDSQNVSQQNKSESHDLYSPLHYLASLHNTYIIKSLVDKYNTISSHLENKITDDDIIIIAQNLINNSVFITGNKESSSSFSLQIDFRNKILMRLIRDPEFERYKSTLISEERDAREQILDSILEDNLVDIDQASEEQLYDMLTVSNWLEGLDINLPDINHIKRRLEYEKFFQPLKQLTSHFKGREKELEILRVYVDALDSESGMESLIRTTRGVARHLKLYDNRALVIHGIGGNGKSTLVSKFILDHVMNTSREELAFSYIDFDQFSISVKEPLTILLEVVRQLKIQYHDYNGLLNNLTYKWRNQLMRTRTLLSDSEVSSSLYEQQEYFNEFENVWSFMNRKNTRLLFILDSFEEVSKVR